MKITSSMLLNIMLLTILSASFFLVNTTANTSNYETASAKYDPWRDLNDDGIINIYDVVMVTGIYGSTGTPINKTALLLTRLQASCLLPLPYGAIDPYAAYIDYSIGPDLNNILHWLDLDKDTPGNQMVIFTPEGANITVSGKFQNWQKPGIISQDFFIYSWAQSWPPPNETYYHPLYSGAPGGYPGLTQTFSFDLTVPNTPGVYYLYYCTGLEYSMTDAVNKYIEPLWFPYAVITVCSSP